MSEPAPDDADAWVGDRARRWAEVADGIEAQLAPVSELLFAAAGIQRGERVLDVGCGRGDTTREAAALVGAEGAVTGADLAALLLDEARARTPADLAPRLDWVQADAQTHPFDTSAFDLVLSRFGVMFFADPPAAFANLARATKPGGRLAAAVWPPRDQIEALDLPAQIAARAADAEGTALELPSPIEGPFSLSDPAEVEALLTDAGWVDAAWTAEPFETYLSGPGSIDEIIRVASNLGALRVALEGVLPEVHDAIDAALRDELSTRHDGVGVPVSGLVAIVTARRPA